MFVSQPTEGLISIFNNIANVSELLKACVRKHGMLKVQNRSNNDKAAMILAYRAIKFIDAYLMVARAGYLEPSAALARAIYETYLWSRWVLMGNGQRYLDTGKSQFQKVARALDKHGSLSPNSPARGYLSDATGKVPRWDELAKQTNIEKYHDTFYPQFSNWTHGNMAGSVDMANMMVTFLPDYSSMEFPANATLGLAVSISLLFEEWWDKGQLAPPM